MWMDPSEDEQNKAWTRGFAKAMEPFGLGSGAYPNFIEPDEGALRVRAIYGDKYDRLVALKQKWDPDNVFRLNQNIAP
jgi:hypothetical protein